MWNPYIIFCFLYSYRLRARYIILLFLLLLLKIMDTCHAEKNRDFKRQVEPPMIWYDDHFIPSGFDDHGA